MRHGEAEVGGTDSCRGLSSKGLAQTAAVASAWLQRKPTIQVAYRSPVMRASQITDELTSQFPELHFKVADWLLPATNPEGMLQKLGKICQLPVFDQSPSLAEESAGLLLVGHNPVLSALWTILQGESLRHPLLMRTSQLVRLDVFALSHDGGAFVYTVEP